MKCDKLKARTARSIADEEEMLELGACDPIEQELVYNKDEVDYAIAELKAQLRKTQRALWLARANRVLEKIAWFKLWNSNISTMNPEDGARQEYDKWKKAFGKCLAKAKEYK